MSDLKKWLSPEFVRLGLAWSGRGVRFSGTYSSWSEAARHAQGYDAGPILETVLQATLAVRDGRAAFERDGVLFSHPQYPYPLLSALMRAAALNGGRLHVLDFGGALGSTYFQCRPWLEGLASVRWQVVEQPHYVACGRERLQDETLRFVERIEDCVADSVPIAAVLSGVLQYVPEPFEVLARITRLGVRQLIVDRTPVIDEDHDVISVQQVPARIVRSCYPIRLFGREGLMRALQETYTVVAEFEAVDGVLGGLRRPVRFRGFILEKAR